MAQPPAYNRSHEFAEAERDNEGGRSTVRTADVDAELDAVATSINAIRTNIALNQRDDGEIRDGRVKLFTLASDVLALLVSYGATPRGDWQTAMVYNFKDLVRESTRTYMCVVAHTSGVFATDLAAGKWLLFSLGDNPAASAIPFTPTATIAASNVQTAIDESDTENRALSAAALAALNTFIANLASTVNAAQGATLVGFNPALAYAAQTMGGAFQRQGVFVNAYSTVDSTGATDCTSAMQAIVDANKGRRIVFGRGTYLIGGLELDGATYNDTVIECLPGAELKLAPDGGASTHSGAWVGVLMKDCARVRFVNLKWNGNRSAMTARQQIFCIGVAGATDYDVIGTRLREIRGDGIYIGQSDWQNNSANPARGTVLDTAGYNSALDGRNIITVHACDGLRIDGVISEQIGGTISAVQMPGGIDIEPDLAFQTVNDLQISNVLIIGQGTTNFAILGKAITNDSTGDWNVNRVKLSNIQVKLLNGAVDGCVLTRIFDLSMDIKIEQASGTRAQGFVIDSASRINGKLVAKGISTGAKLGSVNGITDFDLSVDVDDYSANGVRTTKLTRGTLRGRVRGASSAVNTFAIQCHNEGGAVTQTGVNYEIDAPFDGNNVRAFRNETANAVSYTNCAIRNCDFSGYASVAVTTDANIQANNVRGLDLGGVAQFANADTTPSVGLGTYDFQCNNAGATSITMFDDGFEGREIRVRLDNQTTVVHDNTKIRLKGSANITPGTSNNFVTLKQLSGIWFETGRNF